jgi:hypothetical protein
MSGMIFAEEKQKIEPFEAFIGFARYSMDDG